MEDSYIKILRKLKNWEWYKKPNMVHLFIHLLISANFIKGKFQGVDVERGQVITGIKKLSSDTGISEQSLRTCLKRLKLTGEITIKSTSEFSLITIVKYNDYQQYEKKVTYKSTIKSTSNQHSINIQSTTIEEGKEEEERISKVYRKFDHLEISNIENSKLLELGYSQNQINGIYDSIQNYRKNKNYSSLYLTSIKWLKKEYPNISPENKNLDIKQNSVLRDDKWQIDYEIKDGIKIYGNSHQRENGGLSELGIKAHCEKLGISYE